MACPLSFFIEIWTRNVLKMYILVLKSFCYWVTVAYDLMVSLCDGQARMNSCLLVWKIILLIVSPGYQEVKKIEGSRYRYFSVYLFNFYLLVQYKNRSYINCTMPFNVMVAFCINVTVFANASVWWNVYSPCLKEISSWEKQNTWVEYLSDAECIHGDRDICILHKSTSAK